jgi:hypothetical protein
MADVIPAATCFISSTLVFEENADSALVILTH